MTSSVSTSYNPICTVQIKYLESLSALCKSRAELEYQLKLVSIPTTTVTDIENTLSEILNNVHDVIKDDQVKLDRMTKHVQISSLDGSPVYHENDKRTSRYIQSLNMRMVNVNNDINSLKKKMELELLSNI